MKRREFLKASIAVPALAGLSCASTQNQGGSGARSGGVREYYELREYHLKSEAERGLVDGYLSKALIPALNRRGCKPVGVFAQQERLGAPAPGEVNDSRSVLVLIPYSALSELPSVLAGLDADAEYLAAGAEYLQSPLNRPAFQRIDSWLLQAFAGMPKVELPPYCRARKPRLFELRTYESHSEVKARKKVEMFNRGEIQLMREVGLGPIFYGQGLIGGNLPSLTYLLSAESTDAHEQHWRVFRAHPAWERMKSDPQYADTVSKISHRFLAPVPYSQI